LYKAASHFQAPLLEGKSQQPYYCKATHPKATAASFLVHPGAAASLPLLCPLHPPSRDDFEGPYRNSSLLCQIRGSRQLPSTAVHWLKDGVPLTAGVTTETLVADSRTSAYVTSSRAVVTESEWDSGAVYTCQVEEELRNSSKALECG
ncbi:IGHM protein, partial [Rhynochetos jubatus]|nr:IGHM protein [Rhynochetos jubatus]